jgi:hypothetical protein
MDPVVIYVPRCVQNGSESLGLKALEDFDVAIGGCMVRMGSSTALYRRSLLSVDNVDLLKSFCFLVTRKMIFLLSLCGPITENSRLAFKGVYQIISRVLSVLVNLTTALQMHWVYER